MRKTSRRADTEEDLSHHRAPLNNMLLTATLNLAPALRPRAAKKPAAKRGSLQVVAHGGVGGSGGTQYLGKDKPHGSDQALWRKKLITHDPDQADPDANSGRGGGWTPPPPSRSPSRRPRPRPAAPPGTRPPPRPAVRPGMPPPPRPAVPPGTSPPRPRPATAAAATAAAAPTRSSSRVASRTTPTSTTPTPKTTSRGPIR